VSSWGGRARAEGVELIGPGGLLTGLAKTVLETALRVELSEHLGYGKHEPVGRNGENSRNGSTEDGADRARAGRDRCPAGPGRHVRDGDREEAAAPVGLDRPDRVVADRARPDHRAAARSRDVLICAVLLAGASVTQVQARRV
jgi:hypothetical protein